MVKKTPLKTKQEKIKDVPPKGAVEVLKSWKNLIGFAKTATETQLWRLLDHELANKKRYSYVFRIYGLASRTRYRREIKALNVSMGK